jgi:prepilin-type N-terminal cleavage/methylation domain-containing protein
MRRKILEDLTTKERAGGNRGFSMLELIIVVTVVGVVTGFALLQVQSASANMRVQNSVRQLSSYMEKARVDAVRRHGNSAVTFTNSTTYTVNMDFNNNGTPITRTFSFQDGVQLASSDLPNVTFNWRGRTLTSGTSCLTTFSVSDSHGNGLSIDVSGSGDVTVENQQPTLPNVAFNNTVTSSDGINGRAVVSGVTLADNTPCMDLSGGGVGGNSGPPDCTISTNSTSISIRKNGASTGSVIISMSSTRLVVASYPSNLTVSPASQTLNTGSNFSITSQNTLRGPFNVTFTSQCGSSIIVTVNVTN